MSTHVQLAGEFSRLFESGHQDFERKRKNAQLALQEQDLIFLLGMEGTLYAETTVRVLDLKTPHDS